MAELVNESDMTYKRRCFYSPLQPSEEEQNDRLKALAGGVHHRSVLMCSIRSAHDACYIRVE